MRRTSARTSRSLASAASLAVGVALLAGAPAQAGPDRVGAGSPAAAPTVAETLYSTSFDAVDDWAVIDAKRIGEPGKSQARYLPANVTFASSTVQVTTRRHCVRKGRATTLKNTHPGVCPRGKRTRYSSGRLQRQVDIPSGANYEMEFSAVMPTGTVKGTRPALWANNIATPNTDYCAAGKKNIVEYDAIEWLTKSPGKALHTTHIGCNPRDKKVTARQMTKSAIQPGVWYQWKVRRVGNKITYWRTPGGQAPTKVATHTCGKGKFSHLGKKRCRKLLNSPSWIAIINGEVFARKRLKPNNKAAFPTQTFVVDWFQVRRLR